MCARGPWDVVLFFAGDASAVVMEQARRGRVLSIDAHGTTLAPDVASRVVPEMLGAGCSLRALDLSHVDLSGLSMWATWAATFGEAAVCSRELREMRLDGCHLCGALPEMDLPKLAHLSLSRNRLTGTLEPLRGCTALREYYPGLNPAPNPNPKPNPNRNPNPNSMTLSRLDVSRNTALAGCWLV